MELRYQYSQEQIILLMNVYFNNYSHSPHNEFSVNDGLQIRRW
jgi:hypothetical protein